MAFPVDCGKANVGRRGASAGIGVIDDIVMGEGTRLVQLKSGAEVSDGGLAEFFPGNESGTEMREECAESFS